MQNNRLELEIGNLALIELFRSIIEQNQIAMKTRFVPIIPEYNLFQAVVFGNNGYFNFAIPKLATIETYPNVDCEFVRTVEVGLN